MKKNATRILVTFSLFCLFACLALAYFVGVNLEDDPQPVIVAERPTDTPLPAPTAEPTLTPLPTATPQPTATLEPLEALALALNSELSESNRELEPRVRVDLFQGVLDIRWSINDNLTADMIRRSADIDAEKIIDTVSGSGLAFDSVYLVGEYEIGDREQPAVSASFPAGLLPHITRDNVWELGERVQIHPAFTSN